MVFYDVRERKAVQVPDEAVEAVAYESLTKSGRRRVRYALRATYKGRRLTKFVDEATYQRYAREPQKFRQFVKPIPPGIPVSAFDAVAGILSDEDAEAMLKVIETECERVDED